VKSTTRKPRATAVRASRDGRAPRGRRRALTADGPRYLQVANDLIDGIGGGIYPVGGLLPTEMELCKQ